MINIAVIGYGYWGNHVARNFNNSDNWNLVSICDIEPLQLEKAKKQYPKINQTLYSDDIFNDNTIDAVAITTPSSSHFDLALNAIQSNKHVWVEKPFTLTTSEAKILIKEAKLRNLIINVDHTYIYTAAVRKIKEIIEDGVIGDIIYIDAIRINLGLFQHDVNVLWDLAPHDISIIQYIHGKTPVSVSATGNSYYNYNGKGLAEIAYLTIKFEDSSFAHVNVNWLSPVKIRQLIVAGTRKMLIFDDMLTVEKIKIYDSGISLKSREDVYNTLVQYRTGDMYSPVVKNTEALNTECEHFFDCIINNKNTDTDGNSGLYTVRILEAADESIRYGGIPVKLKN